MCQKSDTSLFKEYVTLAASLGSVTGKAVLKLLSILSVYTFSKHNVIVVSEKFVRSLVYFDNLH